MFEILKTDFYQVAMVFAYIVLGDGNKKTGFEAFVRKIKPEIAGTKNHYLFMGADQVHAFMNEIKKEITNPLLPYVILGLIENKIKDNPNKDKIVREFFDNFKNIQTDFEYTVYPNGGKLFSYVPAFQYKGPIWIGQLIETYICNIINSQTGLETFKENPDYKKFDFRFFDAAVDRQYHGYFVKHMEAIRSRAKEYRRSTTKILSEAGFRRAPSLPFAKEIAKIAIEEGWNGTSNLAAFFSYNCPLSKITGSMAHSYIMSHRTELEGFTKWNYVLPKNGIITDTYDVLNAVDVLIGMNIKPKFIKIDSDPLDYYAAEARDKFNKNKWKDVDISLSGDLTPEILMDFEKRKVPFEMCMAGTEYANINGLEHINAGFVYKIVEVEDEKGIFYPQKKAMGKRNYPSIKTFNIEDGKLLLTSNGRFGINFNASQLDKVNEAVFNCSESVEI